MIGRLVVEADIGSKDDGVTSANQRLIGDQRMDVVAAANGIAAGIATALMKDCTNRDISAEYDWPA